MKSSTKIVGRYAPSPSGEQHLGNLRTALLAWLHARLQQGQFLVRMEDLDTPRSVPGSDKQILEDLEWIGLEWDGPVEYQSERTDLYQSSLNALVIQQLVYPCFCSRKDIQRAASAPHGVEGVYPGTCAALSSDEVVEKRQHKDPALRLRTGPKLAMDCGDFVIKRADGLFAYQLAVVVDDLDQKVSEVIRGADLASSTSRQIYLATLLSPAAPLIAYSHAPLMFDAEGVRMSKRFGSESAVNYRAKGGQAEQLVGELLFGLGLLDQPQPISCQDALAEVSLDQLQSKLKLNG